MTDPAMIRTRVYDERLGWHDHLHLEIGKVAPMNETLTLTQGQIAVADHQVRCVPIATAEQWCFYKHIEYANDLVRAIQEMEEPLGLPLSAWAKARTGTSPSAHKDLDDV